MTTGAHQSDRTVTFVRTSRSDQGAQEVAGAGALGVGRAELGGEEVGGAGAGDAVDGRLHCLLVTDEGDVGGTVEALTIEHGAVARQLPVDGEHVRGPLTRRIDVVGDAYGKTGNDTTRVGPSGFGFYITGTPDIPVVVEAATDLVKANWISLQALNLTNGAFYFSDSNSTRIGKRPCSSGMRSEGFDTWKAPAAINRMWSVRTMP